MSSKRDTYTNTYVSIHCASASLRGPQPTLRLSPSLCHHQAAGPTMAHGDCCWGGNTLAASLSPLCPFLSNVASSVPSPAFHNQKLMRQKQKLGTPACIFFFLILLFSFGIFQGEIFFWLKQSSIWGSRSPIVTKQQPLVYVPF